jgi:hypothetical protein
MHFQLVTLLSPLLRPLAYLDPGSGSFILQLIIGAIAASGIVIKIYWKKIKGLFSRSAMKKDDDSQPEQ